MKTQLQTYLHQYYNQANLKDRLSIYGNVHLRYELGGDEPFKLYRNGKEFIWYATSENDFEPEPMTKAELEQQQSHRKKRVTQATERASRLFAETFKDSAEIWLLIYEYEGEDFFAKNDKGFIHSILPTHQFAQSTINHNDTTAQVFIGRLKPTAFDYGAIMQGTANYEMGFEPKVPQSVYFFDSQTHKGFHMYDDRGCYVWGNTADKIRYLYQSFNSWIVNYHRNKIKKQFYK